MRTSSKVFRLVPGACFYSKLNYVDPARPPWPASPPSPPPNPFGSLKVGNMFTLAANTFQLEIEGTDGTDPALISDYLLALKQAISIK